MNLLAPPLHLAIAVLRSRLAAAAMAALLASSVAGAESVPNAKFEKPFDIAELRRCLHRLVATSRGQKPSTPPMARI